MESFTEQVLLIVIENLLIGILILIAGYFINKLLEQYKTSQAMRSEVAKKRVEELSKIWLEFNKIKSKLAYANAERIIIDQEGIKLFNQKKRQVGNSEDQSIRDSEKPKEIRDKLDSDILPKLNALLEDIINIDQTINTKRFWLGQQLFIIHKNHLFALNQYIERIKTNLHKWPMIGSNDKNEDPNNSGTEIYLGTQAYTDQLDITDILKHL